MGFVKFVPYLQFVLHCLCYVIPAAMMQFEVPVTFEVHSIDDTPQSIKQKQTVEAQSANGNRSVYIDNLHRPFPVFDMKPIASMIKGIGEQYRTIILECLPMVPNFPPGVEDNIYFHFPQVAAELNKNEYNESSLKIWIHPHLHIPFLPLDEIDRSRFATASPSEIAFYMADKANSVFPGTVSGILIISTPLLMEPYRAAIPKFKERMAKRNLKFGLIIEGWSICEHLPDKIPHLKELLSHFDQFYMHQPAVLRPEEKTESALKDAVLEGKTFDVVFNTCKENLQEFIPEGKDVLPIRGYLSARFFDDEEVKNPNRMKFKFDVIRF